MCQYAAPRGQRSGVAQATLEGTRCRLLWRIDLHNRSAHLGIALLPRFRGRGFGVEVVRLQCRYGFTVRGLNRLQLETLADNAPMIGAAARVGFREEGVLRQAVWALGGFADSTVMGLLAADWHDAAG